ncbi:MAG TPA: DEAD/DEAH box helicase, partial [Thermodesulfobacteriota bacterium]
MPFWHGDRPGRPRAFGEAIGALARELAGAPPAEATRRLRERHGLDSRAAANLLAYLREQREATGEVPSDRTIVVERFVDEMGDWRVCILSPFGARVHAPWAMAVGARLGAGPERDVESIWSDDGIVFRVPEAPEPPSAELFLPGSSEVEDLVVRALGGTALFAARFREAAARALLLPRRAPGRRSPLWMQRKRAADLMAAASRHPDFPIVLETYRECLRDAFDLPGLVDILKGIETRRIRVVTVDSRVPSPFAASLQFAFMASFLYDGDAPLAERRAQALRVDQSRLRELLGEAELRELLDADAVAAHERSLQRLDGAYPVRHADGVHDLLLALGDLTAEEVAARASAGAPVAEWLAALESARRVALVRIGAARRYVAVEDVGRYRDAVGVVPPRGLPEALLTPVADPLGDLLARYARTHGPFTADAVASRLGLGTAAVRETLARLEREGRVVEGEFLPHGAGREWVDVEVLRALRRKSLARLRREVEPVEPEALGRFLPDWQGLLEPREGPDALLAAIERLEGAPIPASVLETEVLPARVADYRPGDLDLLCASGEVVWAGVEPLGPRDGRVALYLAEHEPLLARPPAPVGGDLHARIRERLERRGALFFADLAREVGGFPAQVLEALWDLVWSGEVTNDTLVPLRSYLRGRPARGRGPSRAAARLRRAGPPGSEGRWSLRAARWGQAPAETDRRHALARALLERYGVVTREAVAAEGIAGGFSAVYEVLKAMEEAGRVRRGYFVAGCGAAQFALPGADDRLRARRRPGETPETVVLAATDPANPYGAALPWPETPGGRPQRAAGAVVVLVDGALVGYLGRTEQNLVTVLPPGEPERTAAARGLAAALADLVERGRRRALLIARIDGVEAALHPYGAWLAEAGFVSGAHGYVRRRAAAADLSVEPV